MTFQKGNKLGHRFTSDNQPTREARSRGQREALNARLVALEALRDSKITDPQQIAALKKIFPNIKTYYGYHLTVGRMFLSAANGNVKAFEKLMKISGDLNEDNLAVDINISPPPIIIDGEEEEEDDEQ